MKNNIHVQYCCNGKGQKEAEIDNPTHKYITAHFPGFAQAFQETVTGLF
jgi:hypothetical protein